VSIAFQSIPHHQRAPVNYFNTSPIFILKKIARKELPELGVLEALINKKYQLSAS